MATIPPTSIRGASMSQLLNVSVPFSRTVITHRAPLAKWPDPNHKHRNDHAAMGSGPHFPSVDPHTHRRRNEPLTRAPDQYPRIYSRAATTGRSRDSLTSGPWQPRGDHVVCLSFGQRGPAMRRDIALPRLQASPRRRPGGNWRRPSGARDLRSRTARVRRQRCRASLLRRHRDRPLRADLDVGCNRPPVDVRR
jgi:hypothetical protein